MATLYDRAEIYDLLEDETRYKVYKTHWETVLKGKEIRSMLDVSIGSGSVTLPLAELGVSIAGSDLSEAMLARCRDKAAARGFDITLRCSDFRDLRCWDGATFDCVASTGNSLPYVSNADVLKTLEEMDRHVSPGGYLYLDIRNWDNILRTRQRFYLYNPVFRDGIRINLVQAWDYNADGTMTFNLLYTFEKDDHIFQKEVFEENYHPISKSLVLEKLSALGYGDLEVRCFPAQRKLENLDLADWHSILAKKIA